LNSIQKALKAKILKPQIHAEYLFRFE